MKENTNENYEEFIQIMKGLSPEHLFLIWKTIWELNPAVQSMGVWK